MCRYIDGSMATLEAYVKELAPSCTCTSPIAGPSPTEVERINASDLTYDAFVAKYMEPNIPVIIKVQTNQNLGFCLSHLE